LVDTCGYWHTVTDEVEQVECISFTHTVVLSKVNMGTLL
jgi:hypothetical protein